MHSSTSPYLASFFLALAPPLGSSFNADQRAVADAHLARAASLLFPLAL
jgi:hypothetical protein